MIAEVVFIVGINLTQNQVCKSCLCLAL